MEPPMSRTAVEPDDPLAVDGDPLGAGEPQLLDQHAHVPRRHERVDVAAALRAVLQPERQPAPGDRDQPGGDARVLEVRVQAAQRVGGAGVLRLEVADARAQSDDVRLQAPPAGPGARARSR